MKTRHPHSQSRIALNSPCRACGYRHGLLIVRFENDLGFIRCGRCDGAQYPVEMIQEVAA
ncbi:hypothetical protein NIES2101_34765 [Calothrix sp. HK-06]|nr:hypothetical protein NIES2101_34765 [Calothrix sp. HK-06]